MGGVFVIAFGDFDRTAAFYEESESLVWRDAGCALATLQLIASWLGLSSCLLGVVGSRLAGVVSPEQEVRPVGVIAVGGNVTGKP